MTHNDSHLMALLDELKASHNVMDQREAKTLQVIEGLLKRIEEIERVQTHNAKVLQMYFGDNQNSRTSGRY